MRSITGWKRITLACVVLSVSSIAAADSPGFVTNRTVQALMVHDNFVIFTVDGAVPQATCSWFNYRFYVNMKKDAGRQMYAALLTARALRAKVHLNYTLSTAPGKDAKTGCKPPDAKGKGATVSRLYGIQLVP